MKAPISVCIIVRDEPLLEQAVASVRPHVEEICIACNSPDAEAQDRAHALADRFAEVGSCNDANGEIADFAKLRNESFKLATQPFVCWIDADDTLVQGENLARVVDTAAQFDRPRMRARYDYDHDKRTGECISRQRRERIVRNDGAYHWEHPVHETLVAKDGRNEDVVTDLVWWKHMRTAAPADARNLRILREWAKTHGGEPWTLYNLAFALHRAHEYRESLPLYERYVELSGREDERAMAMMWLSDLSSAIDINGNHSAAIAWAKRAAALRPSWFEPLFWQAKALYLRGIMQGDESALAECVAVCERALETPEDQHPLAYNPLDRAVHVHETMRAAAEAIQDWESALEATERGLKARPNDPGLILARKKYSAALKLDQLVADEMPSAVQPVLAGLDVVFVCGPTMDPFNPEIYETRGVGGSETAVIEMAKGLAGKGHRVRVYCYCGREGTWDGVDYLDVNAGAPGGTCDVLISWRTARYLYWCESKVRLVWAHDVTVPGMTWPQALRADRILALSQWHKGNLIKAHKLSSSHVHVTRNGIRPERFDEHGIVRDPHKIIMSSSPDRGLAAMLDMFPAIRAQVKDATLDVYYGFEGWAMVAKAREDPHQAYLVKHLRERMCWMDGVTYHGSVDQKTLARALMGAGVWCASHWFSETSCIAAMEARAAGCRIVASNIAALPETIGDYGVLIDGDWLSPEYQEAFIDSVVDAMRAEPGAYYDERAADAKKQLAWGGVVDDWCRLFDELMAEASYGKLPSYQPEAA